MGDNVHKGHRQRLREKFLRDGLDIFEPHEILELLLFYAIPYRDTNPLAHKLLDDFGSISAIMDAKPEYMRKLGYSDNVISLLKLIPQLSRVYYTDKTSVKNKTVKKTKLGEYFIPRFYGRSEEALYLLLLDDRERELFSGVVSKGSINSTDVPVRKILELSIAYNATYAVMAHNHVNGSTLPSKADLRTTTRIYTALHGINVELYDHIIVADKKFMSLRNSVFVSEIFCVKQGE